MSEKDRILLIRLSFLLPLLIAAPAYSGSTHFKLYDNELIFDVVREGEVVGQHTTRFRSSGADLIVESHMKMAITLLAIPVYSFVYASTEKWSGDQLIGLNIAVKDGTERTVIKATSEPNGLSVDGPSGIFLINGPIIPTNHWNPDVLKQNRVLNTITGKINAITIFNKGEDRIAAGAGYINATRYDYSGDLTDTSAWYDSSGRWVKLLFRARDGSTIEYICKTCEGDQ